MPDSDASGRTSRDRFRVLPEPVRPEDWVETVDAAEHPSFTQVDERDRLLRLADGAAT